MQEYKVYWITYNEDDTETDVTQVVKANSDNEALQKAFELDHEGIFSLYKNDEIIGTEEYNTVEEYKAINEKE